MRVRRVLVVGVFLLLPLLAVGCWQRTPREIPTGIQKLTGTVKATEISAVRRGTHILDQNGTTLYYLESSVVNLQRYEDREVQLEGVVEPNTDPSDIPVLVVSKIDGGPATVSRTWSIPPLGITIDTPNDWLGKVSGQTAQFTASGAATPTLMLFLEGEDRLTQATDSSLQTIHETLGLHDILRTVKADSGEERAEIDLRPALTDPTADVLTLIFSPATDRNMSAKAWTGLKDDILRSIKFLGDSVSSSSSSNSSSVSSGLPPLTGSGVGMPCGGPAGVLCPKGLYCNITDVQANVGHCQGY